MSDDVTFLETESANIDTGVTMQTRLLVLNRGLVGLNLMYMYMLLTVNTWLILSFGLLQLRRNQYLSFDSALKLIFLLFLVTMCVVAYLLSVVSGRNVSDFDQVRLQTDPSVGGGGNSSSSGQFLLDGGGDAETCVGKACCPDPVPAGSGGGGGGGGGAALCDSTKNICVMASTTS